MKTRMIKNLTANVRLKHVPGSFQLIIMHTSLFIFLHLKIDIAYSGLNRTSIISQSTQSRESWVPVPRQIFVHKLQVHIIVPDLGVCLCNIYICKVSF